MPLIVPAFAAAILIALETFLSAAVSDTVSGDRHSSGVELVGQGFANLLVSTVSGIPVAGAAARTAVNSRSGATTPVAGLIHAVTLGVLLIFAAPLAELIPLAALAAVLVVLAFNLSAWHEIPSILRLELPARCSWVVTVGVTVFGGLTIAVQVGVALAALHYVRRISRARNEALLFSSPCSRLLPERRRPPRGLARRSSS
jgi:SulP family sulfate permease